MTSIQNEINLIGKIVDLITEATDKDLIRDGGFDAITDELKIKLMRLDTEQNKGK